MTVKRKFPEAPIVAVSALILNEEKKFLAVKRNKAPGKGQWSLPGGAVKLGETIRDAVAREVREETGLHVKIIKIQGVFDRIFKTPENAVKYHYVIINFLCRVDSGTPRAASDAGEVTWISFRDISKFQWTEGIPAYLKEAAREFI